MPFSTSNSGQLLRQIWMFYNVRNLDLFKDARISVLEPFIVVLMIGIADPIPAGDMLDISQT